MAARPVPYAAPAPMPPLSRLLVDLAMAVAAWDFRRRSRTALARLDDHLLRDIGLDDGRAARETAKPFWRD